MVRTVTTRVALRDALGDAAVGYVPTLGALHAGHASLIGRSAAENGATVVSLFVNPTQFDDPGDAARYPGDADKDTAFAAAAGADLVFVPSVEEVYPPGFATTVEVGGVGDRWEGAARPGHFRGVATVVTTLLNLVRPARSYFGEKDYQQLVLVRRLHLDLALPGSIVACPTRRDADGVPLSSRNARLSPVERMRAAELPRALFRLAAGVGAGERRVERLVAPERERLDRVPGLAVDYLAIVDGVGLEPLSSVEPGARALVAARIGGVRLIDNVALDPPLAT